MLSIEISYKGQKFPSLENAVMKAAADGMAEIIAAKIAPFDNEIRAVGGKVIIDIGDDLKGNIILRDLPEELSNRVSKALNQD